MVRGSALPACGSAHARRGLCGRELHALRLWYPGGQQAGFLKWMPPETEQGRVKRSSRLKFALGPPPDSPLLRSGESTSPFLGEENRVTPHFPPPERGRMRAQICASRWGSNPQLTILTERKRFGPLCLPVQA